MSTKCKVNKKSAFKLFSEQKKPSDRQFLSLRQLGVNSNIYLFTVFNSIKEFIIFKQLKF